MSDLITTAQNAPFFKKLGIYARLSGPGWIQAAVTLGGGSLVGALYLGVIGGYEFMWLQPLAMLCGMHGPVLLLLRRIHTPTFIVCGLV